MSILILCVFVMCVSVIVFFVSRLSKKTIFGWIVFSSAATSFNFFIFNVFLGVCMYVCVDFLFLFDDDVIMMYVKGDLFLCCMIWDTSTFSRSFSFVKICVFISLVFIFEISVVCVLRCEVVMSVFV